jgi:hypothetical protein
MTNKQVFLDISTAHLSGAAKRWLDEGAELNLLGSQNRGPGAAMGCLGATLYGWFMYAGADTHHGMPPELEAICLYATSNGCAYILFDADADEIPELPVYEDFGDVPSASKARNDDWVRDNTAKAATPGGRVVKGRSAPIDRLTDEQRGTAEAFAKAGAPASVIGRVMEFYAEDGSLADELAEPGELDTISESVRRHAGDSILHVRLEAEAPADYTIKKVTADAVAELDDIITRLSRFRASLFNQSR